MFPQQGITLGTKWKPSHTRSQHGSGNESPSATPTPVGNGKAPVEATATDSSTHRTNTEAHTASLSFSLISTTHQWSDTDATIHVASILTT